MAALALLLGAMLLGAHQLAFLCDDAFITFRYVANAHDGHGLVWNRAPFAPVEGYTCFAWALQLWAVWSWFGLEPPAVANALSMGWGVLQFAVLAYAAQQLRHRDGRRAHGCIGLSVLIAIVGNRTFLQWLTSGLETALFNFAFVSWTLLAFRRPVHAMRWLCAWSGAAALAALTRPDGLLLVAAVVATALAAAWRDQVRRRELLLGLAPLATVAAHLVWRRCCYGEWLPNTYFAKIVEPWPEAGWRYAACFALENGTWFVAGVAALWFVVEHVRNPRFAWRACRERTPAAVAVAVCLAHAAYYVLRVGGDHFEYRVFSQWVPLLVLATAAMALRLTDGPRLPIATLAGLLVAGSAGWLHLALTRDMPTHGFVRLAQRVPSWAQPLARWYDRQQGWLLFQNVGVRCQQHAYLLTLFQQPFRERLRIADPPDAFPVFAANGVGVVAWNLPDCAILDRHGLNDWVVARTPVHGDGPALTQDFLQPVIERADANHDGWFDADEIGKALGMLGGEGKDASAGQYLIEVLLAVFAHDRMDAMTMVEAGHISELVLHARAMAHERHPPPGYIEAFEPNVVVENGKAVAKPRQSPLTAERIRAIEAEWRAKARAGTLRR